MTNAEEYIDRVLDVMPRGTPMRSQVSLELRGAIAERISDGRTLDDVLLQLGDPVRLAESYLAAEPLVAAPLGRRALARILDGLTVLGVIAPIAWSAAGYVPPDFLFPMVALIVLLGGSILFGLYLIVAEALFGQTLGKQLLGLRVVRENGARIGVGQAIVRQLPLFLQIPWIDVLFAFFTEKRQRAFELLSKTRVVRAAPQEFR